MGIGVERKPRQNFTLVTTYDDEIVALLFNKEVQMIHELSQVLHGQELTRTLLNLNGKWLNCYYKDSVPPIPTSVVHDKKSTAEN